MSSPELPEHPREGRLVSPQAADAALVRKPQIGDTRPAPVNVAPVTPGGDSADTTGESRSGAKNLRKMTKTRNRVGVAEIAEVAEIVVDAASDQNAMVHVPLSLQSPKPTPNLLSAVGAKNAMAVH